MRFVFQHEYKNFFKRPLNWLISLNVFNILLFGISWVYFGTGLYIRIWILSFRFEWQFDLKERLYMEKIKSFIRIKILCKLSHKLIMLRNRNEFINRKWMFWNFLVNSTSKIIHSEFFKFDCEA